MKKVKRKQYYINYKVEVEKLLFTVLVRDEMKKEVCKFIFSRNGMIEKCIDNKFPYYLSKTEKYKIYFHQIKMTAAEQCRLHKIFPYIPQFTNLEEFCFWYNRINFRFDYSKYTDIKILAYKILLSLNYKADENWNCVEENGVHYLYYKWKDKMNISHIVLLDDEYFISDLNYMQIYQEEIQRVFSFDISKIQPFLEERPNSMLDAYLNGGGRKIFSFLTAKVMNHPMELLGKAGLSKLADNINRYQGIHMNGRTVSDIFNLPLAVLKSVDKGQDLMLYTEEDRMLLAKAFAENRAVFSEPMTVIGELWIRYYYLNAQTNFEIRNTGKLIDTVRYLNKHCKNEAEAYRVFGLYQNYLAYAQRIGEKYIQGLYPSNLLGAVEESVAILQMRYYEEKHLEFKNVVQSAEYQFLGEDLPHCKYRIRVPEAVSDIRKAAKVLHNCLVNYIAKVKEKTSMVVFIEDKENDNQLIGAIEVYSGRIVQASGSCNQSLSEEVKEYLKGYSQRKQIVYKNE